VSHATQQLSKHNLLGLLLGLRQALLLLLLLHQLMLLLRQLLLAVVVLQG
jgi:hypothetical protein